MRGVEGMSRFLRTAVAEHRELDAVWSGGASG